MYASKGQVVNHRGVSTDMGILDLTDVRYIFIKFTPISINCPDICDRPRENRPSSHLGMIVEIPVLKVVISITSFCSC